MAEGLLIAQGKVPDVLLPGMANRHGLVAGAIGTGKTITLRVIAERLSQIGVPVFMADVKGDLSGIARPGADNSKIRERVEQLGIEHFQFSGFPTVFWDLYGEQGHPVRTTVSDMGPLLLSRLLNLNETQSGVLALVFKVADDNGMLLLSSRRIPWTCPTSCSSIGQSCAACTARVHAARSKSGESGGANLPA